MLMAQGGNMIGLRFGSQQFIRSKTSTVADFAGQYSTNSLKARLYTAEVSFLHPIKGRQFLRLRAGIQSSGQRSENTFMNPVFSQNGKTNVNNNLYLLGGGIGRTIAFDKFLFQYGADMSLAFRFPFQGHTTYEYERFADSSFVQTEYRNHYPGGWEPGIGIFFGLQWNIAKHLYLGMEGQFSFYALIQDVETKRTTESYDRSGNMIGQTIERYRYRITGISVPWRISPPSIQFNYQF